MGIVDTEFLFTRKHALENDTAIFKQGPGYRVQVVSMMIWSFPYSLTAFFAYYSVSLNDIHSVSHILHRQCDDKCCPSSVSRSGSSAQGQ